MEAETSGAVSESSTIVVRPECFNVTSPRVIRETSMRSSTSRLDSAFRLRGESSVTVATYPSMARCTSSWSSVTRSG